MRINPSNKPNTDLQNSVANQHYSILQENGKTIILLKKPEIIYNKDFIANVIAAAIVSGNIVEINCGKNSPAAKFIASELCSETMPSEILAQDGINVLAKESIREGCEIEDDCIVVTIRKVQEQCDIDAVAINNLVFMTDIPQSDLTNQNFIQNVAPSLPIEPLGQNDFFVVPSIDDKEAYEAYTKAIDLYFTDYGINNNLNFVTFGSTDSELSSNKEELILEDSELIPGGMDDSLKSILEMLNNRKVVEIKRRNFLGEIDECSVSLKKSFSTGEIIIDLQSHYLSSCEDLVVPLVVGVLNKGINVALDLGGEDDPMLFEDEDHRLNDNISDSIKYRVEQEFDVTEENREFPGNPMKHYLIVFKLV